VDRRGRKTTLSYEVRISDADGTPVEIPSTALPDVPLGRFYALLIGNSKYQKLPPLQTPASDVAAIASVLGARYGFTTTTLFDATNLDITRALNDMAKRLTKDDNLIIYFAGHGAINGERGYWLPVDASEGSDKNWVAAQTVTDWAQKLINARRILIVADSCYSGTLTVNSLPPPPGGSEKEQKQWMRKVSERRSRIALTSGAVSPVLDAGEKGHSIFASAVLHELQQNSGTMTTRQLWSAVEALVAYKTLALGAKQRPQYAPIDGHEGGEFFFKKV
jgi:uncharacterized caspase-like protein